MLTTTSSTDVISSTYYSFQLLYWSFHLETWRCIALELKYVDMASSLVCIYYSDQSSSLWKLALASFCFLDFFIFAYFLKLFVLFHLALMDIWKTRYQVGMAMEAAAFTKHTADYIWDPGFSYGCKYTLECMPLCFSSSVSDYLWFWKRHAKLLLCLI